MKSVKKHFVSCQAQPHNVLAVCFAIVNKRASRAHAQLRAAASLGQPAQPGSQASTDAASGAANF
jgi:hypothetical protein